MIYRGAWKWNRKLWESWTLNSVSCPAVDWPTFLSCSKTAAYCKQHISCFPYICILNIKLKEIFSGEKAMLSGTRYTSTSWKGMSADWETETAQLELFSKLTGVRHGKDFFLKVVLSILLFQHRFFFPIIKRLQGIVVCYLGLKH